MMNQQIVIKAGYLKKLTAAGGGGGGGGVIPAAGHHLIRRARRRWFVFLIFGGLPSLEYYEDSTSAASEAPINSFDLRGYRRVIRSPGDVCSFLLTLPDRVLTLTADSEAEATDWADSLDRGLEQFAGRRKPDNIYGVFQGGTFADDCCSAGGGGDGEEPGPPDPGAKMNEVGAELRRLHERVHARQGQPGVERLRVELAATGAQHHHHHDGDDENGEVGGENGSELNGLDAGTFALLEKKYRELEDWDALGSLVAKRFSSVAGVFQPNPDPPPYQLEAVPMPLAGFFEPKTDVAVEASDSGSFYVNPLPGGPRLSPLSSAVEKLKRQILYAGGVAVACKSSDLLNNVAVVQCAGRFWIAGWNRQATRLHSCLHVGDQVMSLDGFRLESLDQMRRILQGAYEKVTLRMRRLPHAKVFCVKRLDGRSLGLQTVGHKAEICHVQQDGLAASHGLAYRTTGVIDDANFCTWTITEVNGRPLSLWPEPKELLLRLNSHGQEMSLVVQPTDLVKGVKAQLKRMKDYRQFIVR